MEENNIKETSLGKKAITNNKIKKSSLVAMLLASLVLTIVSIMILCKMITYLKGSIYFHMSILYMDIVYVMIFFGFYFMIATITRSIDKKIEGDTFAAILKFYILANITVILTSIIFLILN